MASLHKHRKLLHTNSTSTSNSTLNSTTTTNPTVQTCLYFCNTQKNNTLPYSGFCPQPCLAICPSICHFSLSTLPLPPSTPNKPHNLSPLLITMLILLAITFLLITFYILYTKLYFHFYAHDSNSFLQTRTRTRRRRDRTASSDHSLDDEHGGSRMVFHPYWYIPSVGLPTTAIRAIAVRKYVKEMEERDCAVCLAEFEEGDELRVLPKCSHAFHVPCIDTWLSSHTTCPLCRAPIIPPDHHDHDPCRDQTVANASSTLASVEEASEEEDSTAEVLRIDVLSREEGVEVSNTLENYSTENIPNKDQENLRDIKKGSSSQRWSLERGAANLLSRSLSCSGKIYSSSSSIRPSPNS